MKKIIILLFFLILSIKVYSPIFDYKYDIEFVTYFDYYKERIAYIRNADFSYELLEEYLNLRNVRNKEIVLAQILLETGHFSSRLFKENNNLFGMKHPHVRPTTSLGTKRGHAYYDTWVDSINDYILWYNYMTRDKQYTDYLAFLYSLGYAEDPDYIPKLEILINRIINTKQNYDV